MSFSQQEITFCPFNKSDKEPWGTLKANIRYGVNPHELEDTKSATLSKQRLGFAQNLRGS